MKKIIFFLLISFTLIYATVPGGGYGGFGVGVMVGEPTGLNFKLWRLDNKAYDAGLAWSFSGENSLHLHSDYLIHDYSFFSPFSGNFPFYYGIGIRLKFQSENDNKLGIRIPFGAAYHFRKVPIDIFFETVPIVNIVPDTEFDFNIVFGARIFFK
jgi:hypothetical protein